MKRNEAVIATLLGGYLHHGCAKERTHDLYQGIEYLTSAPGMMTHHLGAAVKVLKEHFADNVSSWTPLSKEQQADFFEKFGEALYPTVAAIKESQVIAVSVG